MPLADFTDYPLSYYLDCVQSSFKTREEMGWNVPERIFRHFVLPIRVNNEKLDTARMAFAREIKPRIEGMSMKDAILEVNHWCHEKLTYKPSDARTLSPLASAMSTLARCGEESTFTVTALRSVGIPARQVYTPRWAHTDDNHAWVEAWADGEWYFMGACEPEPVLNLGWFNAPASRGMLMHTRVFGRYDGPAEKVMEGRKRGFQNLQAERSISCADFKKTYIKPIYAYIRSGAKPISAYITKPMSAYIGMISLLAKSYIGIAKSCIGKKMLFFPSERKVS